MTAKAKAVSADALRTIIDELETIEMTVGGIGRLLTASVAVETDDGTLYAVYEGEHPEWKITFK